MIFSENRISSPIVVEDMLFGIMLLTQPFEQGRYVHLVGLVVAGERVHHDVDAGAEREFALARLAVHHWQHRLAVRTRRPGTREVIGGDDDRGYAIAAARRPAEPLFVDGRWQSLDPKLAAVEASGEVAQ